MIIDFKGILLAASVALNLITTTCIVNILSNVPFDMDKVRYDYMQDVRLYYHKGCTTAAEDFPFDQQITSGWNHNSPMSWCSKQMEDMEQVFAGGLYKMGRKK